MRIDFTTDDRDWLLAPVFAEAQLGPLHCWRVSGAFDLERALESYRKRLVRAKGHDLTESDDPEEVGPWSDLLLRWPGDRIWAHLEPDRIRVYASGPEAARRLAETLRDDLARKTPSRAQVFLIRLEYSSFEAEGVALPVDGLLRDEDLPFHYGQEFPDWNEEYLALLQASAKGMSLFEGPPGTGKTSYIRYLAGRLAASHRFYFLPGASMKSVKDPEFLTFWSEERKSHRHSRFVLVLEDAETLLLPRATDNRDEVSVLLNLTDGLLGDFLRLNVICTLNAETPAIDSALLRPGRLLARRRFGRLPRAAALHLAERLCTPLPEGDDFSLAEIFAGTRDDSQRYQTKRIGFTI